MQLDLILYRQILIYHFVALALAVVRLVIAQVCGLCSGLSILIRQACMITPSTCGSGGLVIECFRFVVNTYPPGLHDHCSYIRQW